MSIYLVVSDVGVNWIIILSLYRFREGVIIIFVLDGFVDFSCEVNRWEFIDFFLE